MSSLRMDFSYPILPLKTRVLKQFRPHRISSRLRTRNHNGSDFAVSLTCECRISFRQLKVLRYDVCGLGRRGRISARSNKCTRMSRASGNEYPLTLSARWGEVVCIEALGRWPFRYKQLHQTGNARGPRFDSFAGLYA